MNSVKYKQRLAKYPDEKNNLKLDIANGFIGCDCKGRHLVLVPGCFLLFTTIGSDFILISGKQR